MTLSLHKNKTSRFFNDQNSSSWTWLLSFLGFFSKKQKAMEEIESLVKSLNDLPDVAHVKLVCNTPNSLNDVTFKIIPSTNSVDRVSLEDLALDLVIASEWKIRDITNSDDWHFNAQVARKTNISNDN
jgi:hypothetical protein